MPAQINFPPITQGDTWVKTFQFNDPDGNFIDFTGCSAHIQFRSQYHGVIYADLSTNNGKVSIDTATGLITMRMMPVETTALLMRDLLYDMDITWPNGQNDTIFSGSVRVIFQITQEAEPSYFILLDLTDIEQVSNFALFAATNLTAEGEPVPEGLVSFDFTDLENSGYFAALAFGTASTVVAGTGPIFDLTDIDQSVSILGAMFGTASQTAVPGSPGTLDFTNINNSPLMALIA